MATIVFDSSTFWNDASTGDGQVRYAETPDTIRQTFVPIPRYGGDIVKTHGQEPGIVQLSCQYTLTGSEVNSLVTTVENKKNATGSLSFPPSRSLTNCRLITAQFAKGPTVQTTGGTVKYKYSATYTFKVLKV